MWYHVYNVRHHTSKNPCLRFLANNDVDGRKHKHILEVFFFWLNILKRLLELSDYKLIFLLSFGNSVLSLLCTVLIDDLLL